MDSISQNEALDILQEIYGLSLDNALTEYINLVKVKGIDDALNDIGNMEKKYYLEQHPNEIYYSEHDKRYRTYLPPVKAGDKRKPVTSVSKENLENKIIAFYKQQEKKLVIDTFEKLYPLFFDYKGKETSLTFI